jgi:hypothetical protein
MTNITSLNPTFYESLTANNAAMLLINRQASLFLGVHNNRYVTLGICQSLIDGLR